MRIIVVVMEEERLVWKYEPAQHSFQMLTLATLRFAPRPISPFDPASDEQKGASEAMRGRVVSYSGGRILLSLRSSPHLVDVDFRNMRGGKM